MEHRTYATLKPNGSRSRVYALICDLKARGCALPLQRFNGQLEFDVSDCNLWWLARGGLKELFSEYDDVATWSGSFVQARRDAEPAAQTALVLRRASTTAERRDALRQIGEQSRVNEGTL